MMDSGDQRRTRHLTYEQKRTLVEVYARTGDKEQARQAAGSPTRATVNRWLQRYAKEKEAGLSERSHARRTQQGYPQDVVDYICKLRDLHSDWGKRVIAKEAEKRFGKPGIVSPSGVEKVLRREGLWDPSDQPDTTAAQPAPIIPGWLRHGLNHDLLLLTVQQGMRLSAQSQARAASALLAEQVWRPLAGDHTLRLQLLRTRQLGLGRWLLMSRLIWGHCLMNSGNWRKSADALQWTLDWMQRFPEELSASHPSEWRDASLMVSLHGDDIWVGCNHHLALMLAKLELIDEGIARLQTTLHELTRKHRPRLPSNPVEAGNLHRDLAQLKLRKRRVLKSEIVEIADHLEQARRSAESADDVVNLSFTSFAAAKFHTRLALAASAREKSERNANRNKALREVEDGLRFMARAQDDLPMRLTLSYVDAASLLEQHGLRPEKRWIQQAAEYCVRYGYRGQAMHLLAIRGIQDYLTRELFHQLTQVTR